MVSEPETTGVTGTPHSLHGQSAFGLPSHPNPILLNVFKTLYNYHHSYYYRAYCGPLIAILLFMVYLCVGECIYVSCYAICFLWVSMYM